MSDAAQSDFVRYETPAATHRHVGLSCLGVGATARKTQVCGPRTLGCYGAVYVDAGAGWLETAATSGRLRIRAGTLVWLFPAVTHTYAPDESGWSELWVLFGGPLAQTFECLGFLTASHPVLHVHDAREITALFAQMRADFATGSPLAGLLGAALVHRLIVVARSSGDAAGFASASPSRDVQLALARIEERALQPLDLDAVARECGMGYSTLRRRFKQATGYSPKEYILRVRLRRAKELLALTSWSVADVATAVGFDDPYYFSRLFHAKEGLAPTVFRAQQRF
jgi:AraC family transcriptional regulator, arabinose operon regulatory protein